MTAARNGAGRVGAAEKGGSRGLGTVKEWKVGEAEPGRGAVLWERRAWGCRAKGPIGSEQE